MKKIIVLLLILCGFCAAHSQDCLDKVASQAIKIDSLQKVIGNINLDNKRMQTIITSKSDTIKTLKSDLSELSTFKTDKKSMDDQLKIKTDSIALLKNQLSDKDRQISMEKSNSAKKEREEYENGKQSVLSAIVAAYEKPFDELLKSSTKESVLRDKRLVGNNEKIEPVLSDLEKYFDAKELLTKKFDAVPIKNAQAQLNQINRESELLDKLKKITGKYSIFNDGLKKTIGKIDDLDKRETALGVDEIQEQKFNKILAEISGYIFNYDFNFTDYPYLSNIVLEIIKRKQPDADADISDLLKNL